MSLSDQVPVVSIDRGGVCRLVWRSHDLLGSAAVILRVNESVSRLPRVRVTRRRIRIRFGTV